MRGSHRAEPCPRCTSTETTVEKTRPLSIEPGDPKSEPGAQVSRLRTTFICRRCLARHGKSGPHRFWTLNTLEKGVWEPAESSTPTPE